MWILIQPADVVPVFSHLKNKLALTYLVTLAGVDLGSNLGVVYMVRSLENKDEVIIKALLDKENARIDTISHLYGVADWFEREAFDLLGITFENHPDLRRLTQLLHRYREAALRARRRAPRQAPHYLRLHQPRRGHRHPLQARAERRAPRPSSPPGSGAPTARS